MKEHRPEEIGAIAIANPKHMDIPWARTASNRFQMAMELAKPGMVETEGEAITIAWNPAHADELLAGTGHAMEELVDLAEAGKPLPHFAVPATLDAKTMVKRGEVESQNIVAIREGSDPRLKNEYIAMSAHIDHLGIGQPINGDSIFNGAMDNASGTAAVLETAARFRESRVKTKRSILFVVVTGEEKGLLGSRYFNVNLTVPSGSIVADVNIDMFLPLYPLKLLTCYGLEESSIGDDVRAVTREMGIDVQADPQPKRNVFIRSDQYNFIRAGVPSVMVAFGYRKGSKEEEIETKWLAERYHAPSDDLNQPVAKEAAGTFVLLVDKLIERLANADARPAWKPDSFFRRYAQ